MYGGKGMVTGIKLDTSSKSDFCEICVKAKPARKPFPKESITEYKTYRAKVVTDVWGPAPVKSIGGKEYYLLFQDLFSHEERIYFLKQKSEVFDHYKNTRLGLRSREVVRSFCWVAIEVVNLQAVSSRNTLKTLERLDISLSMTLLRLTALSNVRIEHI